MESASAGADNTAMNTRRIIARGGFTLLEIMVALTLLGIVLTAIYSTWAAIIKGSEAAERVAAASQHTRVSMSTIEDALFSAVFFTANSRYYGFVADSQNDFSSLSFVARLPRTFIRSGKFGDLVIRRVSFTVEPGSDGRQQLVLRQNPILMDPDKDEMENPVVLAKDVNKFVLEYWDDQNGKYATEWDYTNQLPKLVRITLALGHSDQYGGKPTDVMYSVVNLPAQAVHPEWESAQGGGGVTPPPVFNPGQSGQNGQNGQNGGRGFPNKGMNIPIPQ
jgi:prepilin-type N-terminal cleavage/methylation domain-containing protein